MQNKNTLLAIALLGSFGAASAQSNVTVYGTLDLSVRHLSNATLGNSRLGVDSGISQGSRLGFRGKEELGGGMDAHFVLEQGFLADSGAQVDVNSLFNRQAYVGVGGGWGALNLGRQYSIGFKAMLPYQSFGGAYPGQVPFSALSPGSPIAGCIPLTGSACTRYVNDIQYNGAFGGWRVGAEYVAGEQAGSAVNGSSRAVALQYTQGPLSAGVAYTLEKTVPVAAAGATPAIPGGLDKTFAAAGASYDGGAWRVMGSYMRNSSAASKLDTVITVKQIGATYLPVSLWSFTGAYYLVQTDRPGPGKEQLNFFMVEARYNLSKRTSLYTTIDSSAWSKGGQFVSTATTPGRTQRGLTLGITHNF